VGRYSRCRRFVRTRRASHRGNRARPKLTADQLFARAVKLEAQGHDSEAQAAYIEVIKHDGAHFDALVGLGNLLARTGYRRAARLSYQEAAKARPHSAIVDVNLGNTFLDTNELDLARMHYERALSLEAALPEAHQGLSYVYERLGDEHNASQHRDAGFRERAMTTFPYRGKDRPVRAVLLVSAIGGNIYAADFLDDRIFATTRIFVDYYREKTLPESDLIFNAIGDADRCWDALISAQTLVSAASAPVINAPEKILRTGRAGVSDLAQRIADLVAPKTVLTNKRALSDAPALAFPFLVRAPGFHTGMHFSRVNDPNELEQALEAMPGSDVFAIEYVDVRASDGKYRKYRVMAVGGTLYPLHLGIASDWKVHYFTSEMATQAEHRREEQRFLDSMPATIGSRAVAALEEVVRRLDLDYAGIDFGIDRDGDVVLFEANATMVVPSRETNPDLAYRVPYQERVINATRDLLIRSSESTRS
jgi:glutathione synthase/RimK-type ligase-like ATP-grasp enzyme